MALRILVVCTANVCRSPMGAALLDRRLRRAGVAAVVTSAGTHATSLETADPRAVVALSELVVEPGIEPDAERGLDLSHHRPRAVDPGTIDGDGADLVLTMTSEHVRSIATVAPGAFSRTFTAKEFVRRVLVSGPPGGTVPDLVRQVSAGRRASDLLRGGTDDDIADPYSGSLADVRACAALLDDVMGRVTAALASRSR